MFKRCDLSFGHLEPQPVQIRCMYPEYAHSRFWLCAALLILVRFTTYIGCCFCLFLSHPFPFCTTVFEPYSLGHFVLLLTHCVTAAQSPVPFFKTLQLWLPYCTYMCAHI